MLRHIVIEVDGREFELSFGLDAMARFQKLVGTKDVPSTTEVLMEFNNDTTVLLQALWCGSEPRTGEHYPSPEAMGRAIPFANLGKTTRALWTAISGDFQADAPASTEEGEENPLPALPPEPDRGRKRRRS